MTTVPGWGVVRAGNYGAAVGDPPAGPARSSSTGRPGCRPLQYESAGKRRDGAISREGSVRAAPGADRSRASGCGMATRPPRRYGRQLRARGKKGGVIACAMAHRANRIAYALVRDQTGYDPARWA